MKIRKAVIPAAGLGTRFLPATKAQPKEMLPIVDKPTIQFIIEEAVKSGIEDIVIITGRTKKSIEDHFDRSVELEYELERTGKTELLQSVARLSTLANIYYVRQPKPMGLGHAIHCAKTFVGSDPFAVLLGDDIVSNPQAPALKQLMDVYERTNSSVLGVQTVEEADVSKYGIVAPATPFTNGVCRVSDLIEKPAINEAPSNVAILGRYILTPDIFLMLENTQPGRSGEIQLTDALRALLKVSPVYACHFMGKRYDVGDKFGYMEASIDYALMHPEVRDKLLRYLAQLAIDKDKPLHDAIKYELKRRNGQ